MRHRLRRPRIEVSAKERRTYDGTAFDSRKEMLRYQELMVAKREGAVLVVTRQQPFHLPGGVVARIDFTVYWADGTVTWEDVKGQRTQSFIRNKKQIEDLYAPITITEL